MAPAPSAVYTPVSAAVCTALVAAVVYTPAALPVPAELPVLMCLAGKSMLHISGRKKRSLSPRSYSWDRASPVTSRSQSRMYRQADREYCSSGSATALPKEQGLAEHQPPVEVEYRLALVVHTAVAVADIVVVVAPIAVESGA